MLSAIPSPDIVSSNMHPRYLTLERALICIVYPRILSEMFLYFSS